MPRRAARPRERVRPKSSAAARRLIRAALRRHKTQKAAARALRLPSQAQLSRMLSGHLKDTPAMKAALARADARAKRAWALAPAEGDTAPLDPALVMASVARLERELALLRELMKYAPSADNDRTLT